MTASHPSIFELRHFAVTGELDSFDSAHVNTCDGCSKRLQQLAQNELRARNVRLAADTGVVAHPGLRSAMPAFSPSRPPCWCCSWPGQSLLRMSRHLVTRAQTSLQSSPRVFTAFAPSTYEPGKLGRWSMAARASLTERAVSLSQR